MKRATITADPLGRICVLDVETAPDPLALALAGARGSRSDVASPLHRLADASVVFATEEAGGVWGGFELLSFTAEDGGEEELIRRLDRQLQRLDARTGREAGQDGRMARDEARRSPGHLVTYNGVAHDMIAIRRRAARHLMFDLPGIFPDRDPPHIDLMRVTPPAGSGRWGRLRDVAAGLGIPVAHQLGGNGIGAATPGIRKSQVDVSATFLLLLHELAARRRRPDPVIQGWRAFGHYIAAMGPHGDHLAQFRRHPLGGGLEAR